MSRMTDERLAELTLWVDDPHIKVLTKELVAALKAEREAVEAAEARIKELEAYEILTDYEPDAILEILEEWITTPGQ